MVWRRDYKSVCSLPLATIGQLHQHCSTLRVPCILQDAVDVLRAMPQDQLCLKPVHEILEHCLAAKRVKVAASLLARLEGLGLAWDEATWHLAKRLQVGLPLLLFFLVVSPDQQSPPPPPPPPAPFSHQII